MSFLGWAIGIGVVGMLRKARKDAKKERDEFEEYERQLRVEQEEWRRKWREAEEKEKRRRNTPCSFLDGISEEEFQSIAIHSGKGIRRLTKITVKGPIVYGTVKSQSGISEWYFKIDFNDFGHLTGAYWLSSDNDDSSIPDRIAELIRAVIKDKVSRP